MKPKIRKRREKRISKSLLVNISEGGCEELGLTSNISKNGLFIAAPGIFPDRQEISVWIAVGNEIFQVRGEIRWSIKSAEATTGYMAGGMGIKLKEAPPEYRRYVQNLRLPGKGKKESPREAGFPGRKPNNGGVPCQRKKRRSRAIGAVRNFGSTAAKSSKKSTN